MRSLRASCATAATCGRASAWPRLEPASRCRASSSGSAAMSRPDLSILPTTARGSEGALAIVHIQKRERAAISRIDRQPGPRRGGLFVGHRIEQADGMARIGNPEKVSDAREKACDEL